MESKEIQCLIYNAQKEDIKVSVIVKDKTLWATQKAMAELFEVDRTYITRHLENVFEEDELDEKVACAKIALTTQYGAMSYKTQTNITKFYNLNEKQGDGDNGNTN
jgi:hypothetical protein